MEMPLTICIYCLKKTKNYNLEYSFPKNNSTFAEQSGKYLCDGKGTAIKSTFDIIYCVLYLQD